MKKFLIFALFSLQAIYCDLPIEKYFSYLSQLDQPNGDYRQGEIEVIVDPAEILRVQEIQESRLLKKGYCEAEAKEYSRIGVIAEDTYWIWLRDAVYFPKGVPGTYGRLIWRSELKNRFVGVAVLPILPTGQIVLNLNYRHATRSWELEIPRGGVHPQESLEEAAMREVKEETGLITSSVTFLGNKAPDTGVLSSLVPVYLGKISAQGLSDPEYSEAIAVVIAFTKEELQVGLSQGFLEVTIQGKKEKVPLRDSFLTFALLQAQFRQLLD